MELKEHDGKLPLDDSKWNAVSESLSLSPREVQIIQGIFADDKESTIAHQLGISPHTVHTYVERVYRKLAVNSRVQVVLRVVNSLDVL